MEVNEEEKAFHLTLISEHSCPTELQVFEALAHYRAITGILLMVFGIALTFFGGYVHNTLKYVFIGIIAVILAATSYLIISETEDYKFEYVTIVLVSGLVLTVIFVMCFEYIIVLLLICMSAV